MDDGTRPPEHAVQMPAPGELGSSAQCVQKSSKLLHIAQYVTAGYVPVGHVCTGGERFEGFSS